ncbi:MAG: (d)CMP kinase [Deinococcales bacterium]
MFALPPNFVITLDGLAASGKSSVSKGIASALGVPFLSSGLLYRLITLVALETQTDIKNQAALLEMLQQNSLRFEPQVSGNLAFWNQTNVTAACHSSRVDAAVSTIAQHPKVRGWVNTQLQRLNPPFIAEGRDMGSVVFPNADVKIFLSASSQVRAARRVSERSQNLEAIQAAIEARDAQDAVNSAPAKDALLLDSSQLDLEQTIQVALTLIQDSLKGNSIKS